MFWAERISVMAGIALLCFVAVTVIAIGFEIAVTGDADPIKRSGIEATLVDISDNRAAWVVGGAFDTASNLLLPIIAALLFLMLRERSAALALLTFVLMLTATGAFLVADVAHMTLGLLAADYLEFGGAGTIAVGDPTILQSARVVALVFMFADFVGLVAAALAIGCLGILIRWAPAGKVNPPSWLGGVAVGSAVGLLLVWAFLVVEPIGMIASVIGMVGSMLFFRVLGVRLLGRPAPSASPSQAPAPL